MVGNKNMEKGISRIGLRRMGLVGILGASLVFGGFGVTKASGQSAAYWERVMNQCASDPSFSAKDREAYRNGAYIQGLNANLEAEEAAKKMKQEMEQQTELLKKIQEKQKAITEKANEPQASSARYTPPSTTVETDSTEEPTTETKQTDRFYAYRYYQDLEKDDISSDKQFVRYPTELIGLGVSEVETNEPFAFGSTLIGKKDSILYFEVFRDEKKIKSTNEVITLNSVVQCEEFENGMKEPGEYKAVWRLDGNPNPVGINTVIVRGKKSKE